MSHLEIQTPTAAAKSKQKPKSIREVLENQTYIKRFTDKLNQVSSDIKEVEAFLKTHGLCIEVYSIVDRLTGPVHHETLDRMVLTATYLTWIKDEHGKFRLHYSRCYFDESIEKNLDDPLCTSADDILAIESTPLIECSAAERLQLAPRLNDFLFCADLAAGEYIFGDDYP